MNGAAPPTTGDELPSHFEMYTIQYLLYLRVECNGLNLAHYMFGFLCLFDVFYGVISTYLFFAFCF